LRHFPCPPDRTRSSCTYSRFDRSTVVAISASRNTSHFSRCVFSCALTIAAGLFPEPRTRLSMPRVRDGKHAPLFLSKNQRGDRSELPYPKRHAVLDTHTHLATSTVVID
jgi:hypothetical protein